MKRSLQHIFAILTLAGALTACGPTVKVKVNFGAENPRFVALLPIQAPSGLRPERAAVIRSNIEAELRNGGYSLLDRSIVDRVCSETKCPARGRLLSEFGAQGLVEVDISSASKNNFLAGYVDQINGKLRFLGKEGSELLAVSHRETESGGLLFNSGQILQGLKSSVENYGDDGFNLLAEKFAKTLVSQLPSPKNGVAGSEYVSLERVDASLRAPSVYEVCAYGTPGSLAFLTVGRSRSNLREIDPGRYCGVYRLMFQVPSPQVELRSSYGDVARKTLSIDSPAQCDLKDKFELVTEGGKPAITLRCGDETATKRSLSSCLECAVERFLVYRAAQPIGPFEKIAEMKMTPWVDRSFKGDGAIYQLIAILPGGGRSGPVPLLRKENL